MDREECCGAPKAKARSEKRETRSEKQIPKGMTERKAKAKARSRFPRE
jgi:hypothetical protein